MSRPSLAVSAALLALVVYGASAEAYVLPADFLVRLLAEKRRSLNAKDLTSQWTAEIDGVDGAVDEHLYLKYPERSRLVRQSEDGPHVAIEREGGRAFGPEKAPLRVTQPMDLTPYLLAPAGRDLDEMSARLLAVLKQAGVDTSMVALGRSGDTLVYIIGARPFEPDKAQLWLSKTSFLPLRFVVFDRSKSPPLRRETRYLDFGGGVGGDLLPSVIEDFEGTRRVRRAELTRVSANQALPETLFDLPKK